jgi:hypothetical protein
MGASCSACSGPGAVATSTQTWAFVHFPPGHFTIYSCMCAKITLNASRCTLLPSKVSGLDPLEDRSCRSASLVSIIYPHGKSLRITENLVPAVSQVDIFISACRGERLVIISHSHTRLLAIVAVEAAMVKVVI